MACVLDRARSLLERLEFGPSARIRWGASYISAAGRPRWRRRALGMEDMNALHGRRKSSSVCSVAARSALSNWRSGANFLASRVLRKLTQVLRFSFGEPAKRMRRGCAPRDGGQRERGMTRQGAIAALRPPAPGRAWRASSATAGRWAKARVGLAVRHHRDPRRAAELCGPPRRLQPADALAVLEPPLQAARPAAFAALQELRVQRAEHGAARGIDGDRRVQEAAAAAGRRPRHRRVLDRQDIAPGAGGLGAPQRRRDHLLDRHRWIAQEPGDADLACPVPAEASHPDTACPVRHQPRQQVGPPFSRRRSPNRPNAKSIPPSLFAEGITQTPHAQTRCVNVVGPRQAGAHRLQAGGDAQRPSASVIRAIQPDLA